MKKQCINLLIRLLMLSCLCSMFGCRSTGGGGPGSVRTADGRSVPDDVKWKALGDAQRLRRDSFARAGLDPALADKYSPSIVFLGMDYKSGSGGPVKDGVHGTNNIRPGQTKGYTVQLADDNFSWVEWVLSHEDGGHSLVQGELRYPSGNHGYSFGPDESPGHPQYIVRPDGKKLDMGYVINGRWPSRAWLWMKRNLNPLNWGNADPELLNCTVAHDHGEDDAHE